MNKKLLVESFKKEASKIPKGVDFWDTMVEAIISGKIKGIDPRVHIRNPKAPEKIAKDIHEFIGDGTPYKDIKKKVQVVYLQLVQLVCRGLDY